MQLDDSRIRRLVLAACPFIDPPRLEVNEVNYGDLMGYWYRPGDGTIKQGRVIALKRTEAEVAIDIVADLMGEKAKADIARHQWIEEMFVPASPVSVSPYEGKRGKHPKTCTCSKHLKAVDGEA